MVSAASTPASSQAKKKAAKPNKAKAAAKSSAKEKHPPYADMVSEALTSLKGSPTGLRKGATITTIRNEIKRIYADSFTEQRPNLNHTKKAIDRLIKNQQIQLVHPKDNSEDKPKDNSEDNPKDNSEDTSNDNSKVRKKPVAQARYKFATKSECVLLF